MATEMTKRVGAAILLAELEWTPKSPLSKEETMARAALEAMEEPTEAMTLACWPLYHPWGANAPAPEDRPAAFKEMSDTTRAYWKAQIAASLKPL